MVIMRIVPKEHWDILQEYLTVSGGVVLIQEDVLGTLSDEQKTFLFENDGSDIDYDFGGDADIWVESVITKDHYFFGSMLPEPDDE